MARINSDDPGTMDELEARFNNYCMRESDFAEYCTTVLECLVHRYHVRVVTRDLPEDFSADLNGAEIHIDQRVTPEQRVFLLAHLFGHTVQWNVTPGSFEIGRLRHPPVDNETITAIMEYERDAARFALAMLHEIGITGVDQWLSDYAACDLAYLTHYYRTGEKRAFMSFWVSNTPLLRPQPIPPFVPRKKVFRSTGVVI
jgi:hypothetical protein